MEFLCIECVEEDKQLNFVLVFPRVNWVIRTVQASVGWIEILSDKSEKGKVWLVVAARAQNLEDFSTEESG